MLTSPNATTSSATMTELRPYVVSTSDRILFKRCRRKWDFSSKNRQSLQPVDAVVSGPLWLGTGFHFALEDYYGFKHFKKPSDALIAYATSHHRTELPDDAKETLQLGVDMLDYYHDHWLPQHGEKFETHYVDGRPQVEVNIRIPLDIPPPPGYSHVEYSVTLDRVAIDEYGRIIVVDYKTAKQKYSEGRLELDPQVSSYIWAATLIYGTAIEGACWMQFIKAVPDEPRVLNDGTLSLDKRQYTTAAIYKAACIKYYGKVPSRYVEIINHFASLEEPDSDRFIRRETIYRNEVFAQNEERKIFSEIDDMVDPALSLYPNPTSDCTWDCNYRAPCLAMDDGSDYSYMLQTEYDKWEGEGYRSNEWRRRLQYPDPIEVEVAAA
jgi:hypothetical protein